MSIEIEKSVFIDSLKGRMSPPIYDEAQALLAEGCARRHTHSPARARARRGAPAMQWELVAAVLTDRRRA